MPEMRYRLRWPDGVELECYSPSLVIKDFLSEGRTYPLPDLLERLRQATGVASERVRLKFGFPCSRATTQLAAVERAALNYVHEPGAQVTVVSFS